MTDNVILPWLHAAGSNGVRKSMQVFQGDGTTGPWIFNFAGGYIEQAHVKAYRYDPVAAASHPQTLTFLSQNQIKTSDPIPVDQFIVVYRDTPKDTPIVDYTDGAVLNETNLNTTAQQAVFANAEAVDRLSVLDTAEAVAQAVSTANLALGQAELAVAAAAEALDAASDGGGDNVVAQAALVNSITAASVANAAANKVNGMSAQIAQAVSDAAYAKGAVEGEPWVDAIQTADEALTKALAAQEEAATAADTADVAHTKAQSALTLVSYINIPPVFNTPLLVKSDYNTPCLIKTSGSSLSVLAGTSLMVAGNVVSFPADTAVQMTSLQGGYDYSVWVLPDGTAKAVEDMFSAPATPPVPDARKIGGFHYGRVSPGTTVAAGNFATTGVGLHWTQAHVDDIAGINKYSIWDLHFRSAGAQHGFAFDPWTQTWCAIYFCGTHHEFNGISAYSTNVASGKVLPRIPAAYRNGDPMALYTAFTWWEANEIAHSQRARLPREHEFNSMAYGTTERTSLGGANVTIPLTNRTPGFTSRIGLEQVTGHQWTWGDGNYGIRGADWPVDASWRGSSWESGTHRARIMLGGARGNVAASGSWCYTTNTPHTPDPHEVSLRAVCDHHQLMI